MPFAMIISIVSLLILIGCEDDPYACLWKIEYGNYEGIELDNPTEYFCDNVYDEDACPTSSGSSFGITQDIEYVEGKSCESFGYSTSCGESTTLYAGSDCADNPKNVPGNRVAGEGSSEGNSDSSSCGDYSDRGLDDIQVKSHCQAAWAYICEGNDQGVQISCSNLNGLTQISLDGSNPKDKCPYCDDY